MSDDPHDLKETQWGFIGAGKMAGALIRGMIASKIALPQQIWASDPVPEMRDALAASCGIHVTESNVEVADNADVIVLAVKPQSLPNVLKGVRSAVHAGHLVISIAAGTSIQKIGDYVGHGRRIIRVMPNTPCLVGEGASAYSLGNGATAADEGIVKACLEAVGIAYQVPESLLDAVTGLSGSGPAYAYIMIEALSDGGVRAGLPRELATALAAQTLLGAAKMVLETKQHPGVLKDQVASPGGTTIVGIHALEQGGVRAALMNAVQAAMTRSKELEGVVIQKA